MINYLLIYYIYLCIKQDKFSLCALSLWLMSKMSKFSKWLFVCRLSFKKLIFWSPKIGVSLNISCNFVKLKFKVPAKFSHCIILYIISFNVIFPVYPILRDCSYHENFSDISHSRVPSLGLIMRTLFISCIFSRNSLVEPRSITSLNSEFFFS